MPATQTGFTVHVQGLREVNAAFAKFGGAVRTDLGNELKKAAQPVVDQSKEVVSQYRGASVGTIRSRRQGLNVFVEQGAKKVTGNRGDFGALQMRKALIPALEEHSEEVFVAVDAALSAYAAAAGF